MLTFCKLAWVVIALGLLVVSGYVGVARLRKRAEVRRELAPLARADQIELGEFLGFEKNSPSASQGEFYEAARQQIKSRNERIKTLLMVDPGPYVKAQEALVDLMRKENELVRTKEGFIRAQSEFPGEMESFNMQVAAMSTSVDLTGNLYGLTHDRQAELRDICQQGTAAREVGTQELRAIRELEEGPEAVEFARREAAQSWDKACKWIRWSGVPIGSLNPIRAHAPTVFSSELTASLDQSRSKIEGTMKRLNDVMEKGCQ